MPAPNPATDPLWAYNTLGWTNQGNTGDIPTPGATGIQGNQVLVEPASLSQYITRSLDPDISQTGSGITESNSLMNCHLVEVLGPALTSKVSFNVQTADVTAPTKKWWALVSWPSGIVVAVTANSTAVYGATGTTTVSWTSPTVVASGLYYIVLVDNAGTAVKLSGISALAAECQANLIGGSTTVPLRFATNSTALPASPPAVGSSLLLSGSWVAATGGAFVGLV